MGRLWDSIWADVKLPNMILPLERVATLVSVVEEGTIFHLISVFAGVFFIYRIWIIVYRLYFHPLASYPGPVLGRISSLYALLMAVKRTHTAKEYELIKKYGSPLRITPNGLLFADAKAWSDIYGQNANPCLKDPAVYNLLTVTGATNLLNAVDRAGHARIRRLVSHNFSLNAILAEEPLLAEKVEIYAQSVFGEAADIRTQPVDILDRTHAHYFDIVAQLSFGRPFNSLSGDSATQYHDVDAWLDVVPITSFFPITAYFPIKAIQEGFQGIARLQDFSRRSVSDVMEALDKQESKAPHARFMNNLVTAVDPETGSKLSMDELVENAIIFLVAGSGTTAVTTTYFIWEIGRRPLMHQKLAKEVRSAFPDCEVAPTYEEASKLPYLSAVIEETLRLWGPLNTVMPRVSPGRTISGSFIPKGTSVSMNPYAAARDPTVFPDPFRFMPERWLDATDEMKSMSRPFSIGPRNCVGKHLAMVNLVLTLSRVFQLFDVNVDPTTTESMMIQKDRGTLDPAGGKLFVNVARARQ